MPFLPCGTAAYIRARQEFVNTLSSFPAGMNEGRGHRVPAYHSMHSFLKVNSAQVFLRQSVLGIKPRADCLVKQMPFTKLDFALQWMQCWPALRTQIISSKILLKLHNHSNEVTRSNWNPSHLIPYFENKQYWHQTRNTADTGFNYFSKAIPPKDAHRWPNYDNSEDATGIQYVAAFSLSLRGDRMT